MRVYKKKIYASAPPFAFASPAVPSLMHALRVLGWRGQGISSKAKKYKTIRGNRTLIYLRGMRLHGLDLIT